MEWKKIAFLGLETRVAEFERRQRFGLIAVVTRDLDLGEQRDTVQWQGDGPFGPLVEIDQLVGADTLLFFGVGANDDAGAPLAGADFKAGSVFGMRIIETLLVDKFYRHEKSGMGLIVDVIDVADLSPDRAGPSDGALLHQYRVRTHTRCGSRRDLRYA